MEIFLAGGAGYIGSHMAVELLNLGYDVVIADNFENSSKEVLNRIGMLTNKEFKFYECDLTVTKNLEEIFKENEISCVIHLAGHKAAGESVKKPFDYYSNNLNITLALSETMKKYNVNNIIFSSSACVYEDDNVMPLKESSNTGNCTNPYGWTKYISEQMLRDFAISTDDFTVTILRYFNLIGCHESGLLGEHAKKELKNLPPIISKIAISENSLLQIFGDDYDTEDGTCVRDYIHITDLVSAHILAIDFCKQNKGTHEFNIGTGSGTSIFELVNAFENVTGKKVPVNIIQRRVGDVAISYCNPDKAQQYLGWKAEKTIEDGCRDMWKWQQKNPNGYETILVPKTILVPGTCV